MSQSTRTDRNFCSITGVNERGEPGPWIVVDWPDGHAALDRFDGSLPFSGDFTRVENPQQYASLLKVCDQFSGEISGVVLPCGAEGALDVNNNSHLVIHGEFGVGGGGQRSVSVKGNSHLELIGNVVSGPVLVDEWSDQDYRGSIVEITAPSAVVIKRLGASDVSGVWARTDIFSSVTHTAYWLLKRAVRAICNIQQGQKGPSWL